MLGTPAEPDRLAYSRRGLIRTPTRLARGEGSAHGGLERGTNGERLWVSRAQRRPEAISPCSWLISHPAAADKIGAAVTPPAAWWDVPLWMERVLSNRLVPLNPEPNGEWACRLLCCPHAFTELTDLRASIVARFWPSLFCQQEGLDRLKREGRKWRSLSSCHRPGHRFHWPRISLRCTSEIRSK